MAWGHGGQVFLEVLHRLVASRLHPTPDGAGTDGAPDVPAEQPGRRGIRHQDREGTAQGLQLTAAPLLGLHPQCLIKRRDLRESTALGTAANPAAPPDRSKQARDLTRGKALTPQRDAACRTAGLGVRTTGTFGQYGFDEADGAHTGYLPRRQD